MLYGRFIQTTGNFPGPKVIKPKGEKIKMEAIQFQKPETVDEAVKLLQNAEGDARILAGGTDLLVQLRAHMIDPGVIIDIKSIEETRTLTKNGDGSYTIGSAVAGAEAHERDDITADWPGVVEAWDLIGSTQIQGRASLGGNLCNASPAGDSVPAMVAAGMTANIAGPDGRRSIPVEDVTVGPGKTSLKKGEFVVSFNLPARPAKGGDAYLRLIPRTEMDIAVVGCGAALTLDDSGTVTSAKISLGAVAATVLVVEDAAKAIIGTKLEPEALSALDAACQAACSPIDDKRGTVEYRTKIAGVLGRRAVTIAAERAGNN
jgi:CO/xanthine dehydrogenase FAD-binding subunit